MVRYCQYRIECLEIYEAYLNLYFNTFIRTTICSTPPGYHPIPSTYSSTVLHPIPSTFIQNMVPLSVGVKLYAPLFELADTKRKIEFDKFLSHVCYAVRGAATARGRSPYQDRAPSALQLFCPLLLPELKNITDIYVRNFFSKLGLFIGCKH